MAESMKDYETELEASFKKIEEGDILTGTVISVDEKEVVVDLKYYAEGIIPAEDYSREPGFSLKEQVNVGDEVTATVVSKDDGNGNILLSRTEAADVLAWDKLKELKDSKEVIDVVVKGIVNGGVIAYVEGVRGFIPASKLALNYVEDTNKYLNKPIQVQVFDIDKEKGRLILSAKEILREKAEEERKKQMIEDYPEVISKLTLLLGAGMTVRKSWRKIVNDYDSRIKQQGKRAVYEEMKYTCRQMDGGVPEAECYEKFGRRCGTQEYMRFGALLSQNLRKGTKGLNDLLRLEAIQSFEERKARARRLGEEAGTKLLLPMFLMLAEVLVIVVVPAFFTVQM